MHAACTVDDCGTPRRTARSPYCEKHYYRLRRKGTLDAKTWHKRGECSIDGCASKERHQGQCAAHYYRMLRNGRVDPVPYAERAWPREAASARWTGDDATYVAVHRRVRSARGRARLFSCVDCGGSAAHWSYDRVGGVNERTSALGPYSVRVEDYSPRCVPCHKRFDLAAQLPMKG